MHQDGSSVIVFNSGAYLVYSAGHCSPTYVLIPWQAKLCNLSQNDFTPIKSRLVGDLINPLSIYNWAVSFPVFYSFKYCPSTACPRIRVYYLYTVITIRCYAHVADSTLWFRALVTVYGNLIKCIFIIKGFSLWTICWVWNTSSLALFPQRFGQYDPPIVPSSGVCRTLRQPSRNCRTMSFIFDRSTWGHLFWIAPSTIIGYKC